MKTAIAAMLTLLIGGCGTQESDMVVLEINSTMQYPKDENTTLSSISDNVTVTVDGDYYVFNGSGTVIIGDTTTTTQTTTTETTDNTVIDDHSQTDTHTGDSNGTH